jgi:hypothetical protein
MKPRRGVLAAALIVLLGLTGVCAYAVGRARSDTSVQVSAENGAGERDVAAVGTDDSPTIPTGGPSTETPETTATAVAADDAPSFAPTGEAAGSGASGGQLMRTEYEEAALTLLAERVAPGDITLRAHLQDAGYGTPSTGRSDGWSPAGWCYPTAGLRISISTSAAVNIVYGAWYAEPKDGVSVTTFAAGHAESSPVWGAAVQVSDDVVDVAITTPDGRTDHAAPQNGIAVLAVDGDIAQDFGIDLQRAPGAPTSFDSVGLAQPYESSEFHDACEPPPPELPAPGEQPSDPTAAEAEVRATLSGLYGNLGKRSDESRALIDDETGIQDAVARLDSGPYAANAVSTQVAIAELVFTTATEAWFRYDIVTDNLTFSDRFGIARQGDDGVWRITRQTICQDLALAPGAECDPPVAVLYPPGSEPDQAPGITVLEG